MLCALFVLSPQAARAQGPNIPTWRYDSTMQGQNTQEATLTPVNVNTNTFGKLFSQTVDGQVYAQPLYVQNLTVNGATHNVVFIATQHDSVYAFDADTNGGAASAPLWQASLISTAHGAAAGATTVPTADVQGGTGDIHPEIGISGTPVIDVNAQTLFVVAKSKENGNYVQRLHALNLLNGNERSGSPVVLSASVTGNGNGSAGGTLTFSSLWQHNRPALTLFNGNVYLAFGSHGDDGPWHGWVLVYNETTLKQTAAVCLSPNGNGDGIWSSGAGMPIDTVSANGRGFLVTGNGDLTTYPPLSTHVDYSDSILRFDLSNGGFTPVDAFTPFNQATLAASDLDQAAGGILMLPDQTGTHPHLLVQIGKEGRILVLNRDQLNGYVPGGNSNTNALQDITGAFNSGGLWSTPAYWNGHVYVWASNDSLKDFLLTNGVLATKAAVKSSVSSSFPGASPTVSSNGTQNGIVWALVTDLFGSNGSSILYAFDATNIASPLYASNQNPTRDDAGPAIKFTVPVVTHGKVYVGAGYQFDVYGLIGSQTQAPEPVISPAGGTYSSAQQITLTDSLGGAAIYYTTDGSMPTTASTLYTVPFQLSSGTTVQAMASAGGFLQSAVATATYAFNTQTAAPQFAPAAGTYTTTQSVTITDATPGSTIHYTTDGSMPTAGSTIYTGALSVSGTMAINAIATSSGLTASNVATASYSIQPAGTGIDFGNGFASVAGMTLNGSATNVDDTRLQLTTGLTYQAGSAFYNTPTNIQAFTTDFAFQLSGAGADGFTFTMQNVAPTAMGGNGGSLGYGPVPPGGSTGGIAKSVAIKFDFFSNSGEGTDSTGIYVNGASPTVPSVDMTSSGVLLASGDTIAAHITYDAANLVLTLTDIVVNKTFTRTFPMDIPGTIGSNLAYIGFTGGTGGQTSSQKILSWTYTSQAGSTTQAPVFSSAGGTYTGSQQVTLTDATNGAVIYYTIDSSTPTTASTVYSAPIHVDSGTVTIKAMAQASGASASAVTSATYTIQAAVAATPTFSPGTGTYTAAQQVTLAGTTPGAVIYYTVDSSTPTTGSAVYGGAIQVSASETLKAIAVASGYTQSAVGTAAYVIQTGSGGNSINFASGFPSATGLQLNGVTTVNSSNYLQLTGATGYKAGSAFWTTPVNIQSFTTNFTFQLSSVVADGFTFTIQNAGASSIGGSGSSLGYGPTAGTTGGIAHSVAVKFDIYSNAGEGTDSTGFYLNGVVPTVPSVNMTSSGVVLTSGDTMAAQLTYDGTTLTLSVTDTVTGRSFNYSAAVNIPGAVGASTAYVGFTGGTGGSTAIQNIKTWTFTPGATRTAADPVFSPAPGTYIAAQQVSLTSATAGATIYYTVDGSMPTHSSTIYSAPINVSGGSLTIRAFASASGYQDSPIDVGAYQIQPLTAAATPTFSPAAGTYSTAQTVTLSDTTPGAVIFYTTDGTAPTTASAVYSAAIKVSASETVKALATASGHAQSAVASAAYVIQPSGGINLGSGFGTGAGLQLNGTTTVSSGGLLQLTNGGTSQAGSAFWTTPVNVAAFTTNFSFQLVSAAADGFTFTIQNAGVTALGGNGGDLGYGPASLTTATGGIARSVAVKFDFFNNNNEGSDSTGYYLNGVVPTVPAIDITPSGVVLSSGDTMNAQLNYDGTTLKLTLTDTVTAKVFTYSAAVNIPGTVGASTAYVGFTGGTGGASATQNIKSWTFTPGP